MMLVNLKIKNETSGELTFARITQPDDGPWMSEPPLPATIKTGSSILFSNRKGPLGPEGPGWFAVDFKGIPKKMGSLLFEIQAVGAPTIKGSGPFNFAISGEGHNYTVTVTAE